MSSHNFSQQSNLNLTINTPNSSFRKLSNSSRRSKSSSDKERMLVFNNSNSNMSCQSYNNISYHLEFDQESKGRHSNLSFNEAEENQK